MTHYHDGERCPNNLCSDKRDYCTHVDADRGPCTLSAGHPTGPLYSGFSDSGHLYMPFVAPDPTVPDNEAAVRIASGRLSSDGGDEPPAGVADLGNVLRGEIALSGPERLEPARGYPDLPPTGVRPSLAIPAGFTGPSEEEMRVAGERLSAALTAFTDELSQRVTGTARAATLVAALVERVKVEAPPDPAPSLASTVDVVCELLRETGMLAPSDVAVVRAVIVHLVERQP